MTAIDTNQLSVHEEVQRLSRVINDMEGVLRSQREILRQRGMNLPSGVLTGLQDVHIRLENLANELKNEQKELEQLRALAQTTALINSSLELDAVLNSVMDTVITLIGAERAYLMLRNEQTGEMEYRIARNLDRETIEQSAFVVSRSVVNSVAESGQPVVTTNAQNDPRFSTQDSIVSYALRSILCVPLKVKDRVTGVIYADNKILTGLFGDRELDLLYSFANQAAVAIENARLFEQMRAALAEITEIKDLMNDVFTSIASGVIVTDGQNRITTYNKAAAEILGLRAESAMGASLIDVLPKLSDGLLRLLETVRNEKRRVAVELTPELDERGARHLDFRLSPLRNADQTTEGVAIVLDDLTEMRQHEAQLNVVRRYLPPAMVDNIQSIAQLGLGGVRRHITVMYVDVRPMDTFPPGMTPKQQMAMLNRYLALSSTPVHRHEGVIDKYMGTEVMALFNTQLNPAEDHAWQAIQAALDMADDFDAFHAQQGESGEQVYYRMGIHSGIATMGNVGSVSRREFTAIGDTVNLAHRLVDLAQRGEILISQDVYDQCAGQITTPANRITVIDRGEITIRGRRQPVRIYQLRRETR